MKSMLRRSNSFFLLLMLLPLSLCCRWTVFIGKTPAQASAMFLHADHSLVRQSYRPPYIPLLESQTFYRPNEVTSRNHEVRSSN